MSGEKTFATKSIGRSLQILNCFSYKASRLRVVDISNQMNITQSTASRYLSTLYDLGFLSRDDSGYYSLGSRLITLSGIALNTYSIYRHGIQEIQKLSVESGKNTILSTYNGNGQSITLAANFISDSLASYARIGQLRPLHCTATGKALLANMSPGQQKTELRKCSFQRKTQYTIASADKMLEELQKIQKTGYATAWEEDKLCRYSIAAPILNHDGSLAGAVCIGDDDRNRDLPDNESLYASMVMKTAEIISGKMGYFN